MRILRVHIRNLNSLRGEHTIDFTASPLADHSLYAIVGPTGAGKTTILDAITLALYGQTERNKTENDRRDGSGTVLTYGEGDCAAELEYETATGRYLSRWTRQRAHRKSTGNLIASKHSISAWRPTTDDDPEPYKLLATKKKEVAARTLEIVGLDYERFVRSVMLTQGDFARFLKSDPGNKAEILEKITGTGVYRDLSVAAFRRAKEARLAHERALELAGTNQPLPPEERRQLDEQLTAAQTQTAALRTDLTRLTNELAHHARRHELEQKITTAQRTAGEASLRYDGLTTDRDRLALSDRLQPLRPALETTQRLSAERDRLTAAIQQQRTEGEQQDAAVATAEQATENVNDQLNDYYAKLPERQQKIATVDTLEREIANLERDVATDAKREAAAKADRQTQQAKLDELTTRIAALERELAGLTPPELQRQLAELDAGIPTLTARREELIRQATRRQLADRLAAEQAAAAATAAELRVHAATLKQAEAEVTALETELKDRRDIVNGLQLSASLTEHKQHLAPGEKCPVCGATEHPALVNFQPVEDSAIERANADVNRVFRAGETARQQLRQLRQEGEALTRRHDAARALVAELTDQLGDPTTVSDQPHADLVTAGAQAAAELAARTAEQSHLRRLQAHLPELTAATTAHATAAGRLQELTDELKAVTAVLDKNRAAIDTKRKRIRAEVGERTAQQCREMTQQQKTKLDAKLAAAEQAAAEQRANRKAQRARLKLLEEQLATVNDELTATAGELTTGLRPHDLDEAAARAGLLPEATAQELRARIQEVTTARDTAHQLLAGLSEELKAAVATTAKLAAREALDADRLAREHDLAEANKAIGGLSLRQQQDEERRHAAAEQAEQLAGLRRESDRWATMSRLIGSADGKKFRSYAQAITLQRLITVGNGHLGEINPRYRMEYVPPAAGAAETLEIAVVDTYQDDNRRTVSTLSGGETFLISLALALGLSDLASGRNLIQSLFIDEGFGTLDGKTLDQAMNTLEQLQGRGKTIGLISHVASLQERIRCQIRLVPVGEGFSRIDVVD